MFSFAWSQESDGRFAVQLDEVETVSDVRDAETGSYLDTPPKVNNLSSENGDIHFPDGEQAIKDVPLARPVPACCKVKDAEKADEPGGNIDDPDAIAPKEKFHWRPALIQSLAFAGFQNAFRAAAQGKTRRELGGPFFRDWGRSVRGLRGWRDGDNFITNYVGHPMQGAFTGRIFVNNSDRARKQEFGASKEYWVSRGKALAWSAAWSTQFELGPLSEATIGNVGMYKVDGYNTMAYVDLVVTPVVGTGLLIGEDAIDRFVLKNWLEKKSSSKFKIKLLRTLLTPTTSLSNMVNWKVPWKRYNRPL
jgi:hypothetical protein